MTDERFLDRQSAGRRLAKSLLKLKHKEPIVLGIPRGGIVVAAEIAKALVADFGIVVTRKLEAPYQPELNLGAVTADGNTYINQVVADEVGANQQYLMSEQRRQAEIARQHQQHLAGSTSPSLQGREVIVVDDGLVTGATAIAAARFAKTAGAERVLVAIPVGPPDALDKLRSETDLVICLQEATSFLSVARYYDTFPPVDDSTIRQLLQVHQTATIT